mmetsp:Transcript_62895/g.112169  ORF Transcript_62895/g.112169 Transcript_62895/m.112169 type:complete len:234 (+) Transcript_62895:382-1083(+)
MVAPPYPVPLGSPAGVAGAAPLGGTCQLFSHERGLVDVILPLVHAIAAEVFSCVQNVRHAAVLHVDAVGEVLAVVGRPDVGNTQHIHLRLCHVQHTISRLLPAQDEVVGLAVDQDFVSLAGQIAIDKVDGSVAALNVVAQAALIELNIHGQTQLQLVPDDDRNGHNPVDVQGTHCPALVGLEPDVHVGPGVHGAVVVGVGVVQGVDYVQVVDGGATYGSTVGLKKGVLDVCVG